jgi:hypothetical protein
LVLSVSSCLSCFVDATDLKLFGHEAKYLPGKMIDDDSAGAASDRHRTWHIVHINSQINSGQ